MNITTRGPIAANAAFAAALDHHRLWTFDRWWQLAESGEIVRDLRPQRFTAHVDLSEFPGLPQVVYIKCHRRPSWKEHWKSWLRLAPLAWGAQGEWQALLDFQGAEIPVATPVVCGVVGTDSLLVTAGIEGCRELHDVVRENQLAAGTREIGERIAAWARRMHALGYCHQDFYLAHFLHRIEEGRDRLWLMDLHRARRQKQLALRWRVKDLAQLLFSARQEGISLADCGRFWKAYLNRDSLHVHPLWRRLIRSKAAQIERRCTRLGENLDTATSNRAA